MNRDALLASLTNLQAQHERMKPAARKVGDWYNFKPVNDNMVDIYMYGEIGGYFGVTANEFVQELVNFNNKDINLHINSPGGSIFEGAAIYTALISHKGTVTAYIDGVAASAASFIAMAANKVIMSPLATMMIHDGEGVTIGNEADHIKAAGILGKLSDTIATAYAMRTNTDAEQWRAVMREEKWYNAQEAIDAGIADQIGEDIPAEPTMRVQYDLSALRVARPEVDPPIDPIAELPPDPDPVNVFDMREFQMALLAAQLNGA